MPSVSRLLKALPLLLVFVLSGALPRAEPATSSSPRLVVLVFFDQMRGDYLSRWGDLFDEGGFRRLTTEGAGFQECHYPYAYTITAAGHASVVTGRSPESHGIVGNEWF